MTIKTFIKKVAPNLLGNLKKTAIVWDVTETADSSEYWWNFPIVRDYILTYVTGNPKLSWYAKQIQDRKTPFGRILAFGDGKGMAAEAHITKADVTEVIYLNIANGEGERFKKLMKEHNCPHQFIKADANTFNYQSLGKFDTIIDVGAFHHFENFERIFPMLNDCLTEDGLLYVDEYVGPSKWVFTQHIIDIINEELNTLPQELVKNSRQVVQKEYIDLWSSAQDPSEGVRSAELDEMLLKNFKLEQSNSFGGTFLQPFFYTSNLKPCRLNIPNWHKTDKGKLHLERLVKKEHELIKSGKIGMDYKYYVFSKK